MIWKMIYRTRMRAEEALIETAGTRPSGEEFSKAKDVALAWLAKESGEGAPLRFVSLSRLTVADESILQPPAPPEPQEESADAPRK